LNPSPLVGEGNIATAVSRARNRPKAKRRFTLAGQPFFCIAGIWRDGAAGEPPDFTMLTTAPGLDVAPYHDRQVAVLQPADWPAWINLTRTLAVNSAMSHASSSSIACVT
jgi:putative SOS response-associated peptidase YedK